MRAARVLAVALVALPGVTLADGFDTAARSAEKLPSLREFLEKYVGACSSGDPADKADCKRRTRDVQRKLEGKSYLVSIGDVGGAVSAAPCGGRDCKLLLVPFFDGGGGFALSRGSPKGKDKNGNPVLDLLPVPVVSGTDGDDVSRAIRTGMVSVDIVFQPEGVWTLERSDGSNMAGIKGRFVAVRIKSSRTGAVLGEKRL